MNNNQLKASYKFDRKLTKEQREKYITICELAFGHYPVSVDWAINTNIYKQIEAELISSNVINQLAIIEPLNIITK